MSTITDKNIYVYLPFSSLFIDAPYKEDKNTMKCVLMRSLVRLDLGKNSLAALCDQTEEISP